MAGKSASAFDVRVGERLRAARMTAGVSQAELGRLLGVSFQQSNGTKEASIASPPLP